jgi:hypothetical protein
MICECALERYVGLALLLPPVVPLMLKIWQGTINFYLIICIVDRHPDLYLGPSWSWSYGSWIYYFLCNLCLSPLTLWVRIPLRRGVLDKTLCDKACQWLVTDRWLSPVSSNKTDFHDITEILVKVALSTKTLPDFYLNMISRKSILGSFAMIIELLTG